MADKKQLVELRVTKFRHTHEGKTYQVGESFMGTERMAQVFGDRLKVVNKKVKGDGDIKTSVPPKTTPQAAAPAPAAPTPPTPPQNPPAPAPAAPSGKK